MLRAETYDGEGVDALARRLALPQVVAFDAIPSTMDIASELAADGAPAGTLVIANQQVRGRGRGGRSWTSRSGAGVWCTMLERVTATGGLEVLSLRVGLRVARALDPLAPAAVGLKWPNDLYLQGGKLGGILVETRWRGSRPEWTAIGLGINVREAVHPGASSLGPDVARLAVLDAVVPAIRAAAAAAGRLTARELAEFAARDVAAGRTCREPVDGVVAGVDEDGALRVETGSGTRRFLDGSLVLAGDW